MTEVADSPSRPERYVGGGVLRKEDPELVTGQAQFVDDITLPGMVWLGVARSPFAHARINGVDLSRVRELPGVVAAWSGEDLADEWAAALPCAWPISTTSFPTPTDEDPRMPDHWPVAKDKARFAGDAVAVVVAESRAAVKDALEAVEADLEPLDAVLEIDDALADGAPVIHDELGSNDCYTWTLANEHVGRVFSEAPVVVKERYVHPRLIPNAIEPRGVVVQPVPAQGELTIWSSTQIPH